VVLPVHDEERLLPGALEAIEVAVSTLPMVIRHQVAIVLDECGDDSAPIAFSWARRTGALVLRQAYKNVGMARRTGAEALLRQWPELESTQIWLSTTDADSRVPNNWLTRQLEAHQTGADLWAGRVRVTEESATALRWRERYAAEGDPIHGANLGFSAAVYRGIGGFRALRTGEDRDLHRRAAAADFRVTYDLRASVTTSSRRSGRAPDGFAEALDVVDREHFEATR
jgi:hypothetical protein